MAGETHIPAKQLENKGTFAELKDRLLENEAGWCSDDNVLYIKNGDGNLVPLSKIVVVDSSKNYAQLWGIVFGDDNGHAGGAIPVLKQSQGQGSIYLYPEWLGPGDFRFGGIWQGKYYWAICKRFEGTWEGGSKDLGDKVTITPTIREGKKIAGFSINGVDGELFIPDDSRDDEIDPIYNRGIKIADFKINGQSGALFIPDNSSDDALEPIYERGIKIADFKINGVEGELFIPDNSSDDSFSPIYERGLKIADFKINGQSGELYIPDSSEAPCDVEITPIYDHGVKIADFSINGVEGELYAPAAGSTGSEGYGEGDAISIVDRVISVKYGDGLDIDEDGFLVAKVGNGLEVIDGVIVIKEEVIDVTDEMVTLLHDMDHKITSTFPYAQITGFFDFKDKYKNGDAIMVGQLFLVPVAQELRNTGDYPTHITVYCSDTAYSGDVCFGIYEYYDSTVWIADTGPVHLSPGVNHFPLKYIRPGVNGEPRRLESSRWYYAVIAYHNQSGQPANGINLAGAPAYSNPNNSACLPAISMRQENLSIDPTAANTPRTDWSGNASTLENAWFRDHSEAMEQPRLFMLISNREEEEPPEPPGSPFRNYDSYTLGSSRNLGQIFVGDHVSNIGNAMVMQRITPAVNVAVKKIAYVDTHRYAGPNSGWSGTAIPLIMDGTTYQAIVSHGQGTDTIVRGDNDGATIDGTHYIHEYELTNAVTLTANTNYWVPAIGGLDSTVAGTGIIEFTAPQDASDKTLLLMGDLYNPAQSATNEVVSSAGRPVCLITDTDGNTYLF